MVTDVANGSFTDLADLFGKAAAFLLSAGYQVVTNVSGAPFSSDPLNFIAFHDAAGVLRPNITAGAETHFVGWSVSGNGIDVVNLQWANMSTGAHTTHTAVPLEGVGNTVGDMSGGGDYYFFTDKTYFGYWIDAAGVEVTNYVGLMNRVVPNENRKILSASGTLVQLAETAPPHWDPDFWGLTSDKILLKLWNQGSTDLHAERVEVASVNGSQVILANPIVETYQPNSIMGDDPAPSILYSIKDASAPSGVLLHTADVVGVGTYESNTGVAKELSVVSTPLTTPYGYNNLWGNKQLAIDDTATANVIRGFLTDLLTVGGTNQDTTRIVISNTHMQDFKAIQFNTVAAMFPASVPFVPLIS